MQATDTRKKSKLPTKEEQNEMNKNFDNATALERSRLSFVQIDLGELGIFRAELTPTEKTQFARDIISGLESKGAKCKNSKGGKFARNILARAFWILKKNIESGEKGAAERWGNKAPKEPYLAPFPDGTGGNPF